MNVQFGLDVAQKVPDRYGSPEILNIDPRQLVYQCCVHEFLGVQGIRVSIDGKGRWLGTSSLKDSNVRRNTKISTLRPAMM